MEQVEENEWASRKENDKGEGRGGGCNYSEYNIQTRGITKHFKTQQKKGKKNVLTLIVIVSSTYFFRRCR